MHVHFKNIPIEELRRYGKAIFYKNQVLILTLIFILSGGSLILSGIYGDQKLTWSVLWTITVYLLGVGMAGPAFSAILLIVKARWSAVGVRIFDSFVLAGWIGYSLFWISWFGKELLFPWGDGSGLPGKELYMQPGFAYLRIGLILGGYLIYATWFVLRNIKLDLGYILSFDDFHTDYRDWEYISAKVKDYTSYNSREYSKLSYHAPIIVILYAVTMSLFSFEFVMSMDKYWYSNLFGGHFFVTSIYMVLCFSVIIAVNLKINIKPLSELFDQQFFWDLGKLVFGFSMLWAYFAFSQFLVQWYGNLPEETHWLSLRTREFPWKSVMWFVFGGCFVFPFLTLLSQDVKKNFQTLLIPSSIAIISLYMERFWIIAPSMFGNYFPGALDEIFIIIGGLGFIVSTVWLLVLAVFSHYPFFNFSRYLFLEKLKSQS